MLVTLASIRFRIDPHRYATTVENYSNVTPGSADDESAQERRAVKSLTRIDVRAVNSTIIRCPVNTALWIVLM